MKANALIFDMDGTLYQFDKGAAETFGRSAFGRQIGDNVQALFRQQFGLDAAAAAAMFQDLDRRFAGEISLGLEREHGIPRSDYFAATWNLDPRQFMERDAALTAALESVTVRRALLSAAPQIWIDRVLGLLELREAFNPHIFNGEPDIRKPNPEAFLQVAKALDVPPEQIVAIGDQEHTDILPARAAGMRTLLIGTAQSAADFTAPDAVSAIKLLTNEGII